MIPPRQITRDLSSRVQAAQAALDAFKGKPFAWGKADCVRLAAFTLRQLGYRPGLSRGGYYSTAVGARKALAKAGFASIEDALRGLGLVEMAPARALPADLVCLASDEDWPALGVVLGNGRILAFNPHTGACDVASPAADRILTAWGV